MFPSGPSATSFGWLMPSARVVTEPPREIRWTRLLNVSATYTVPSAATASPCGRLNPAYVVTAPVAASRRFTPPSSSETHRFPPESYARAVGWWNSATVVMVPDGSTWRPHRSPWAVPKPANRQRLRSAPQARGHDGAPGGGHDADPAGTGFHRRIRDQPRLGGRRARDRSGQHARAGTAQHGRARQEPHIGSYTDGARKVPATLSAWTSSATWSLTSSRTSLSKATSWPSSPTHVRSRKTCSSRSRAR